ncbi:MAG: glycogen/starch/alpha-glucan phosphorylase, partial [Clostridia bacterium]|nr:glycogen/starch/alpha-glucan phosphorylase [Clostridia bacterium]
EILKRDLFRDFYLVEPWKFLGITNGITHRRWLMQANPKLTAAITDAIGEGWKRDMEKLQDLLPFANDREFCKRIGDIKRENKLRFADFIRGRQGVTLDPDTLFDVQSKRLHEYKRQLMNILHVIYLYDRLVTDPAFTMPPQTFLFAAKAYPNYRIAKEIILLINKVADMIERNPRAKQVLKVAFLENYSVSAAEILIPAAEVSEQISTAGKEASGTGNMKFMMNGALTIGTLDGANVEIHDQVGDEDMFLFGMTAEETDALFHNRNYSAGRLYESNPIIRRVLDYLINGRICPEDPQLFQGLHHRLLFGVGQDMADPFLVLSDLEAYAAAQTRVRETYQEREKWNAMAVRNIAKSGIFASDRTIVEYNQLIWWL